MSKRNAALLALMKRFEEYQNQNPKTPFYRCSLGKNDDYFHWRIIYAGPEKTRFYGGFFPISLFFDEDFPQTPPKMKFECPIFHPNISEEGYVCMSIIHDAGIDKTNSFESAQDRWRSTITIDEIMCALNITLQDVETDAKFLEGQAPNNAVANGLFMKDRPLYYQKLHETVENSINFL